MNNTIWFLLRELIPMFRTEEVGVVYTNESEAIIVGDDEPWDDTIQISMFCWLTFRAFPSIKH